MQIKKYLQIFFVLILTIPWILELQTESENIETRQYEMNRYATKKENSPLFGILEIPKISIKQPIYQKNREENQVDKNITLLEETLTQETTNSVIVLASHSGTGIHSYFKNLSNLKSGDLIYFYYKEEKRTYELFKKEEVLKTGTITFDDYNFSYIILITCSKEFENIQEVYYAKLL